MLSFLVLSRIIDIFTSSHSIVNNQCLLCQDSRNQVPYFESKGNTLYYNETGSGPVVIFIAGMGADYRDWTFQRIALKKYFRLIAIDNRGVGKSHGGNLGVTIEGMASDIDALLKSIKTDTVHIVGHSMGSMIALEYAIKNPEKVLSLILSSLPVLPVHNCFSHSNAVINDLNVLLDNECQKVFIQKFLFYLFSPEFQKSDQFKIINEFIRKSHKNYNLQIIRSQLKAIREWGKDWELNRLCRCPCLFIYGSEDKFISLTAQYSSLSDLFTNASFTVIKGGGHALHIEKAKEFNDIVYHFIKNNES